MTTASEAYSYCQDEVRRDDPDRFHAALFADAGTRGGLFALYALNIEIARGAALVREPMLGEIRLQWWRETVDALYAGDCRAHPIALALAHTLKQAPLPRAMLDAFIDARAFDLDDAPMDTRAALRAYARATAGHLFALAARVLAPGRAGDFDEAALAAGEAYAGAGLLRALAFYARRRKLFLPADILRSAGVERETIFAGRKSEPLAAAIALAAEDAHDALKRARNMLRERNAAPVLPAFLPLVLVKPQLRAMTHADYDPFLDAGAPPLFFRQARLAAAALLGRP